jgi:hypothetical protein
MTQGVAQREGIEMRGRMTSYREAKAHLPAPARRVVEELVEVGESPEHVARRLVTEEGCELWEAHDYMRAALAQALMEMTGADFRFPLEYSPCAA